MIENKNSIKMSQIKTKEVCKSQNPPGTAKFRILDSEDPPPPEKLNTNISLLIQKARVAKKMSQKDLGVSVNIKANIINDYESGKAIPDRQILIKLGRFLGVKLV